MSATAPLGTEPLSRPGSGTDDLRVALAHDWIVEWAGSERVLGEIASIFPNARVLTALLDDSCVPHHLGPVEPSVLQRLPIARNHHQWSLPLMPAAWRVRRPIRDVDLVISSSHACAKAVRVAPGIPHLCYCHTPMRYAWDFNAEATRFPRPLRLPARGLMAAFRRWDARTASNVYRYVANSTAVADRIARIYGRRAVVIHPPVRTDYFTPGDCRREHYLFVGRMTGYKRPGLVVDAFAELPHKLVVVGDGPLLAQLRKTAPPNVEFVGKVDDCGLRDLYRRARALVYPVDEDFGIAMAEAQACGTPVIGYVRGGAADIVSDTSLGILIGRQHVDDVRRAVACVERSTFDPQAIAERAARFSAEKFRAALTQLAEETVVRWRDRDEWERVAVQAAAVAGVR